MSIIQKGADGGQWVVFSIGQHYALKIDEVMEIIRVPEITEVPKTKYYLAGVINLRGRIIPVVNLRKRFHLPTVPTTRKSRIVVVLFEGEQVGLLVDEIRQVATVETSQKERPPEIIHDIHKECIEAFSIIESSFVGLIQIDKVFEGEGM